MKGEDPIESRPGFSALLDRVENNGVKVAIVEDASRLAPKLVAQELGVLTLCKRGIKLITSSGDDLTETDDEGRVMMRQIAGAFAVYEKRAWSESFEKPANVSASSAAASPTHRPCRKRSRWRKNYMTVAYPIAR